MKDKKIRFRLSPFMVRALHISHRLMERKKDIELEEQQAPKLITRWQLHYRFVCKLIDEIFSILPPDISNQYVNTLHCVFFSISSSPITNRNARQINARLLVDCVHALHDLLFKVFPGIDTLSCGGPGANIESLCMRKQSLQKLKSSQTQYMFYFSCTIGQQNMFVQ